MQADPFDLDLPSWDAEAEPAGDLPAWNPAVDGAVCSADEPAAAEAGQHARLKAFYAEHNPSKLGQVDANLRKYKGREAEMWRALHRKYSASFAAADSRAPAMADMSAIPAHTNEPASPASWRSVRQAAAPVVQTAARQRITTSAALLELFHATGFRPLVTSSRSHPSLISSCLIERTMPMPSVTP